MGCGSVERVVVLDVEVVVITPAEVKVEVLLLRLAIVPVVVCILNAVSMLSVEQVDI